MMRVNGRTFYSISKDSKKNAIWLADDSLANCRFLADKLRLIDVYVERILTKESTEKEYNGTRILNLDNIDSALHENIVIIYLGDLYNEWYDFFCEKGLKEGWEFKWIKRYSHDKLTTRYAFDPIIGFNSIGNDERYPGYNIVGNPDGKAKRIVVLGASATDSEVFNIKSWPECLYDIATENNKDVVIFNGATTGYTCSQEMIKILRDLQALSADVVISFSGMNNNHMVYEYPFFIDYNLKVANYFKQHDAPSINSRPVLPFRAIKYSSEKFDKYLFWLNQERTMHYYCSLYGVPFIGILEPNLMSKDDFLPEEKEFLLNRSFMGRFGLTPNDYIAITRKFKDVVKNNKEDWLYDLSDIFDEEVESVYFDGLHVSEHGNYVIANNIYKIIETII